MALSGLKGLSIKTAIDALSTHFKHQDPCHSEQFLPFSTVCLEPCGVHLVISVE